METLSKIPRGRLVTFYSWKGGVGRTMALANIGIQLARRKNRVLLVDWDLEAPGLTRYFIREPSEYLNIEVAGAIDGDGLLGLLNDAAQGLNPNSAPECWQTRLITISHEPGGRSTPPAPRWNLVLLPSGYGRSNYSESLASFSWSKFFKDHNGGQWLESLREQWASIYDFILIDSRTGLTDSGGICTIQMPDILALVFTANNQSLEGGIQIVEAAQHARRSFAYDHGQLVVLPILSRWEGDREVDLAEKWINRFNTDLRPMVSSWLPRYSSPKDFLEKTRVPHVSRFSFGEPLPVLTHSITDLSLSGLYYDVIVGIIHSQFDDIQKMSPPLRADSPDEVSVFEIELSRSRGILTVKGRFGGFSDENLVQEIALGRFFSQSSDDLAYLATATSIQSILPHDNTLNEHVVSREVVSRDTMDQLQNIGTSLFKVLFDRSIETLYRTASATLIQKSQRLVVKLKIPVDDSKLSLNPWEALFDPVEQSYLALSARTAFARSVPGPDIRLPSGTRFLFPYWH